METANGKTKAYQVLSDLLNHAKKSYETWNASDVSSWHSQVETGLRRLEGVAGPSLQRFQRVIFGPYIISTDTTEAEYQASRLRGMRTCLKILNQALREFEIYELENTTEDAMEDAKSACMNRKIFVVHGHDNEMKNTVARFLEKIDFEAVILHERPNAGATIIEKFEHNSDVPYAVVLLSPDDVGKAKAAEETNARARQNVILELGYFIGRLGRSNVCSIVRGKVEQPSDVHGIVYVPYENDTWKLHLVKELKHAGFDVDANLIY